MSDEFVMVASCMMQHFRSGGAAHQIMHCKSMQQWCTTAVLWILYIMHCAHMRRSICSLNHLL